MVLLVNEKELALDSVATSSADLLELLLSNDVIKQNWESFCYNHNSQQVMISDHSLFVCQSEFSIVNFSGSKPINWIGTSGATTCHIVVIHDDSSVALAHMDSPDVVERQISKMVCGMSNTLSVYVIGGFSDERNFSHPLSCALVGHFHQSQKQFVVKLFGSMVLNTKYHDNKAYPIVTDVAFNIQNRTLHKAQYDYRGPALELRSVMRHVFEGENENLFNQETGCIEIPYFEFEMEPRYHAVVNTPDNFLLTHCSTSPHCEPHYFCDDMRKMFLFRASEDSNSVFGPDKLSVVYEMDENGKWVKGKSCVGDLEQD